MRDLFVKRNISKQLQSEGNMNTTAPPTEEWVHVTPQVADTWLQRNEDNRRLHPARVLKFAEDMEAGRWADHHPHGIAFDRNGRLIDGQHRLHAVVLSGVPVWMRVTKDLEPEMHTVFDLGAPRSAGHVLQRSGVANSSQVSSIVSMLFMYDRYPDVAWNNPRYPSKTWQVEYAQEHNELLQRAVHEARQMFRTTRIPHAQYATLYVLADRNGLMPYWETWHTGLLTGAGLQKGDPRLTLRNYFSSGLRIRERSDTWQRQRHLAIVLKAYSAYIAGKPIKQLKFEKVHLPMPTLVDASTLV